MPDCIGFGDALARLLAKAYGEHAQVTVYTDKVYGELEIYDELEVLYTVPPERRDPVLANEQYRTATGMLLTALRTGDVGANEGRRDCDGKYPRLPISFWHMPPYAAVPPPDELTPLSSAYGDPIRIDEARFEAWLSTSNVAAQAEPASQKSDRGFADDDAPLVDEIIELRDTGKCKTDWLAAGQVAPRAEGYGSPESKQKRLHRRVKNKRRSVVSGLAQSSRSPSAKDSRGTSCNRLK